MEIGEGGLDCLVNNAGCLYVMPLLDTDEGVARGMFEVNFWGVLGVVRACGGVLVRGGGGVVVNVSSVAGGGGMPWMGEWLFFDGRLID